MKRNAAGWLAILSVSLNALWPLVASADPGIQDPTGSQVCTTHGVVAVSDSDRQLPNPGDASHRLTLHCAFCALGGAHAALLSVGLPALETERAEHEIPAARRFALLPWFLSASLRSRSPPR